jgi:hypothetical protein
MAHALTFSQTKPWHGIGVKLAPMPIPREALPQIHPMVAERAQAIVLAGYCGRPVPMVPIVTKA